MGEVDELAERYVEQSIAVSPIRATYLGVPGLDDTYDDFTVEGFDSRADLDSSTLTALEAIHPESEAEQVAKDAMGERLSIAVERHAAGDIASGLSVISSPMHSIRSVLDVMGTEGTDNLSNIAVRLSKVGPSLRDYAQTLRAEAAKGNVAARRQVTECAKHADNWNGASGDDFWEGLLSRLTVGGKPPSSELARRLGDGAAGARAGLAEFGRFLREELAPLAPESDAVGLEKYSRSSRHFLGSSVDLEETYQWGWQELHRIETEMAAVADIIKPGSTIDDAIAVLDAQPERNLDSKEAFQAWMQDLADATVDRMAGTHFDIPEPVRRIECKIAPTSDGPIYYTGPSEDFSRPGRMWWSIPPSQTSFSTWRQVTTVYHEGVPGHHLQIGQTAYRSDILNRYQRRGIHCSGHSEGWALYSERLMDELGYLTDPGEKLGMLDGQAMRAARVIIDIGMHLRLPIPVDNPFGFHPGQVWTPELGWQFLTEHVRENHDYLRFELNRYLGWPGQAPSYKVGERLWLAAREEYRQRKKDAFDLRRFHTDALNLGTMGLDPFAKAMRRL